VNSTISGITEERKKGGKRKEKGGGGEEYVKMRWILSRMAIKRSRKKEKM